MISSMKMTLLVVVLVCAAVVVRGQDAAEDRAPRRPGGAVLPPPPTESTPTPPSTSALEVTTIDSDTIRLANGLQFDTTTGPDPTKIYVEVTPDVGELNLDGTYDGPLATVFTSSVGDLGFSPYITSYVQTISGSPTITCTIAGSSDKVLLAAINSLNQYFLISNPGTVSLTLTGSVNILRFRVYNAAGIWTTYKLTINKPTSVIGDPQFLGLRGQSYQIHGIDQQVYNLFSDASLQINSRFVFLASGACPMIDGKKSTGCWTHPGSYLGETGILVKDDNKKEHQIYLRPGAASKGFEQVKVDGEKLEFNERLNLTSSVSLIQTNAYSFELSTPLVTVTFENSDLFVNVVGITIHSWDNLHAHGLIGQTWQDKEYNTKLKVIEGEVDDYAITDNVLYGKKFIFNQYA